MGLVGSLTIRIVRRPYRSLVAVVGTGAHKKRLMRHAALLSVRGVIEASSNAVPKGIVEAILKAGFESQTGYVLRARCGFEWTMCPMTFTNYAVVCMPNVRVLATTHMSFDKIDDMPSGPVGEAGL